MTKDEQAEMLAAMREVPGIGDLAAAIEEIISRAAFDAPFSAADAELHFDLDFDFSMPPPALTPAPTAGAKGEPPHNTSRSTKISIRVPTKIVEEFRVLAVQKCVPYQRLMNRALKASLHS